MIKLEDIKVGSKVFIQPEHLPFKIWTEVVAITNKHLPTIEVVQRYGSKKPLSITGLDSILGVAKLYADEQVLKDRKKGSSKRGTATRKGKTVRKSTSKDTES